MKNSEFTKSESKSGCSQNAMLLVCWIKSSISYGDGNRAIHI